MYLDRAARLKLTGPRTDAQKAVASAKREANMAKQQATRATLLRAMRSAGLDLQLWELEFRFYGPKVRSPWRFDLAHPNYRIGVEIDGGSWGGKKCIVCGERAGGRHSRGGREQERKKLNTAAAYGWLMLCFASTTVEREAEECAALIVRAFRERMYK